MILVLVVMRCAIGFRSLGALIPCTCQRLADVLDTTWVLKHSGLDDRATDFAMCIKHATLLSLPAFVPQRVRASFWQMLSPFLRTSTVCHWRFLAANNISNTQTHSAVWDAGAFCEDAAAGHSGPSFREDRRQSP
jgi:hypothetical protein